jgi:hypothetical protein
MALEIFDLTTGEFRICKILRQEMSRIRIRIWTLGDGLRFPGLNATHRVLTHPPLGAAKAGRNHFNS